MDRLTAVETPGQLRLASASVADAVRLPAHRLRVDRADWPGIFRRHGRRSRATASRRRDGLELPSAQRGGFWDWLVSLFRFPCPTSSATRAQVWLDLKSNGLPVLTIGVALAIVILLLCAVSGPIDAAFNAEPRVSCPNAECFYARAWPPALCAALTGDRIGPRGKCLRYSPETRTHVHQRIRGDPGARHRAAGLLKVLVKSVCVLAAIIAIGVSAWISVPLLGDAVFIQMWNVPLSSQLSAIKGAVAALTGYEQLSLVVVAAVGVVIWVAAFAVFGALRTRYSRRVNIAASSAVALWSRARAAGAGGTNAGSRRRVPAGAIFGATSLDRRVSDGVHDRLRLLERLRGARADAFATRVAPSLVSAAFGAAWLTVLRAAGVQLAGMPATNAVSDAVAGAAAADGQRPGALVAQPHSPYVTVVAHDQRTRCRSRSQSPRQHCWPHRCCCLNRGRGGHLAGADRSGNHRQRGRYGRNTRRLCVSSLRSFTTRWPVCSTICRTSGRTEGRTR